MAETLASVARQAVAQLGLDQGFELATQFAGQRYQDLCARAKMRHLRQYGQLFLPTPIQTGTCTLTINSAVVPLDATALAACVANPFLGWPDGFAGLWFRAQTGTTWYRIIRADAVAGTITLETPFAYDNSFLVGSGITTLAGVSFYILPRYTALDPTARQLGVFMCDFIFRPLTLVSEDQLNLMVPSRYLVSTYPQFVAELNSNLNMTGYPKMVEIYPPPTQSTTIHYTFWQTPPLLQYGDYLPPTIDPDIIRTGAKADLANNRMGKAIRMGNLEEAAMWRNIANQENSVFEQKVPRGLRNDRGAEDVKFILRRGTWRVPLDFDPNQDAWSNFLLRGY